eukprot:TRINITY_DN60255_c0_g1_i2.p1 TRINITY_DN60255_c0_g1~~TRINITY_DN60255_c0_g1_i2.p1  ORF type:complete len:121 (-),score=0.77 TRINITY_DN60255_c0_g1_i2:79-441(-)
MRQRSLSNGSIQQLQDNPPKASWESAENCTKEGEPTYAQMHKTVLVYCAPISPTFQSWQLTAMHPLPSDTVPEHAEAPGAATGEGAMTDYTCLHTVFEKVSSALWFRFVEVAMGRLTLKP